MKTINPLLQTQLDEGGMHLTKIFTIRRKNKPDLHFTECDINLIVGGNTFTASNGFIASEVGLSSFSRSQQVELTIFENDLGVTREDIQAGVYDNQSATIEMVDFRNTGLGTIHYFSGFTSESSVGDDGFVHIVIEGLMTRNRAIADESFSSSCRNELGDSRCMFNIEGAAANFTITSLVGNNAFITNSLINPTDHWKEGFIKWTGGDNDQQSIEVRGSTFSTPNTTIVLWSRPAYPLVVGVTGRVYLGCAKTVTDCLARFNNILNFRGEPYIPSQSTTAKQPVLPYAVKAKSVRGPE
jgi:uncharacterized phage protein (TIGR02218 family)